MTFLASSPLPDAVEAKAWRAYVSRRTRTFFDDNCRDDSFDAVCFMLVPRPASLPIVAVLDAYDEVDTIYSQTLHAITMYEQQGVNYVENANGQIVLAWPLFFVDDDHRDIMLDLLRETARDLKATATALVSECWMRSLTAPSGTGSDVLMICCEQVGHNVAVSVAEITGEPPARSLGAWLPLDGLVAGRLILGLFNEHADTEEDTYAPPPGFTLINVATVGEA